MTQRAAYGMVLRVWDVFTDRAYETIANIADIGGPAFAADALDASAHDSASAYMEQAAGLIGVGEITLDLRWAPDADSHQILVNLMVNRWVGSFQIVYPDTTQDNFLAFVTSFEPGAPVDDMLTASVTLQSTHFPIIDSTDGYSFLAQEDSTALLTEAGHLILVNNAPS